MHDTLILHPNPPKSQKRRRNSHHPTFSRRTEFLISHTHIKRTEPCNHQHTKKEKPSTSWSTSIVNSTRRNEAAGFPIGSKRCVDGCAHYTDSVWVGLQPPHLHIIKPLKNQHNQAGQPYFQIFVGGQPPAKITTPNPRRSRTLTQQRVQGQIT